MSETGIIATVTELQKLKRMQEELAAEIDALQDAIKAHMNAENVDAINAGGFKIAWKEVTSTRIDTAALRKDFPEIWKEYGKISTVRRFTVAAAK